MIRFFLRSIFLLPMYGQAQITYYDENSALISSPDSCHYYSVVPFDLENRPDTVATYYCSNKQVRSISVRTAKDTRWELVYHKNGKVASEGTMTKHAYEGEVRTWHPNGGHRSVYKYEREQLKPTIVHYWDSTGVQLIKSGSGMCRCLEGIRPDEDEFAIGKFSNGKKDSVWTGIRDGVTTYVETYENGELVKGTSYKDGQQFKYSILEKQAEHKGGLNGMYSHIRSTLRYPATARKNNIQGSVYVSFVISATGTISDVHVLKSLSPECDGEAVHCVTTMKPWVPAVQRGQNVKTRFILPIKFKLQL